MSVLTIVLATAGILGIAVLVRALTTPNQYPPMDLCEIDREGLFRQGEQLLADSEGWRVERRDGAVSVSSSVEPFASRAVRYELEVEADFHEVVDYVKDLNYCGEKGREAEGKIEETLYERNIGLPNHEWVRRSVHASNIGSDRDTVAAYFEDRPDPRAYRIVYSSVDAIDGEAITPYPGTSRFVIHPAVYCVQETSPGRVRIRKIQAVDPLGSVSSFLNNYLVSLLFFRSYMFDEAKTMRDDLSVIRF